MGFARSNVSRRPDKRLRAIRQWGWHLCLMGGRVPFTRHWGVSLISYAVNGTRGAAALPLSIPAAPRGNRCCALRSPPACLTAAGSTRLARPTGTRFTRPIHGTRPFGASASAVQNCSRQFCPVSVRLCPPSMASRPCHSRSGSPISAGTQPLAVKFELKKASM